MAERATEPHYSEVFVCDKDGIPVEWGPMAYDQADLAIRLGSAIRLHRDTRKLRWHIELNDRIDWKEDDGTTGWRFPDLYVVCGIQQRPTPPYRIWVLDKPPDVIFEFATSGRLEEDLGEKRALYERLGVGEYFVFDVDQAGIPGVVEGHRLGENGRFAPIPIEDRLPVGVRLHSQRLGLDLGVVSNDLVRGGLGLAAYLPSDATRLPTELEARSRQALQEKDDEIRRLKERVAELERERSS